MKFVRALGFRISQYAYDKLVEIYDTGTYVPTLTYGTYGDPIRRDTNMENGLIAKGLLERLPDASVRTTPFCEDFFQAVADKEAAKEAAKIPDAEKEEAKKQKRRDYARTYQEYKRRNQI